MIFRVWLNAEITSVHQRAVRVKTNQIALSLVTSIAVIRELQNTVYFHVSVHEKNIIYAQKVALDVVPS